jgi:phosphoglycolate phosphatase-like HAD superfamily hydrolase
MRPRPLLLFDCDGKLFAGEDELAQRCFGDVINTRHPERTVRGLVRDLGVDPDAWVQRGLELYFDRFADSTAADWRPHDGVEATLRRLKLDGFRLAAVSARPEAIVRFRLERLGIGGYFAYGTGGFGCEVDGREDLLRLALWRSASIPRRAVYVTEPSLDAAAARRLGVPAIAVESLTEFPALLSERPAA